jgi:transposase
MQVCFSDESKIDILQESAKYVRRRSHEALLPECVTATVKHPTSIMVWGAISVHGTGRLFIVEGTMRQEQYIRVLRDRMIPQLRIWYPNGDATFMQDGAPCHTARNVMNFLRENNVPVLSWPGNSPDLNPIENLWYLLKRKINARRPTNKRALTEALIHIWNHDQEIQEMCPKLINGMVKRVQTVLKNKGGYTKY